MLKNPENKNTSKGVKSFGLAFSLALLILAIVIPINLIAERLDIKWDMTPRGIYSLSSETKELLNNLDKDVYFYTLFDIEIFKTQDEGIRESMLLYSLFKQYEEYPRIKIIAADPETKEGHATLTNLGVGDMYFAEYDILVVCNDAIKRVKAKSFIAEMSDRTLCTTEDVLSSAIKFISGDNVPTIYFSQGSGEKDFESNYSTFSKNLQVNNYISRPLNLAENAIPEDAETIIIASPTKDFTAEMKTKLDVFFDNGGKVIFMMDPSEEKTHFVVLDSIINEFGYTLDYNIISESKPELRYIEDENVVQAKLTPWKDSNSNVDFPDWTTDIIAMADSAKIITFIPPSRSFIESPARNENVFKNVLLESSTTWISTPYGGPFIDNKVTSGVGIEDKAKIIGAYAIDNERLGSAVVLFGSDFIRNDRVSQETFINPSFLMLQAITWAYEGEYMMRLQPKVLTFDTIAFNSGGYEAQQKQANRVIALLWAVPILVAGSGIFIWWRRSKN